MECRADQRVDKEEQSGKKEDTTAARADWVAQSNARAQPLVTCIARFEPEWSSRFGDSSSDSEVCRWQPGVAEDQAAAWCTARTRLEQLRTLETQPELRLDLDILIAFANKECERLELETTRLLPNLNVARQVFFGLRWALRDPANKTSNTCRAAATIRLRRYAGLEHGFTPLVDQAREVLEARRGDPQVLWPYEGSLRHELAQAEHLIVGIERLAEQYHLGHADAALAKLREQITDHSQYLQQEILPHARDHYRLPAELYGHRLGLAGIDLPLPELVSRARLACREIQNEMQALARLLARERGWPPGDYREAVQRLRNERIPPDEILQRYEHRTEQLARIIEQEKIVSLPPQAPHWRLATSAESAANPFPRVTIPSFLTPQRSRLEIILPSSQDSTNDFLFEAAILPLIAHEARPGHELQFTAQQENALPLARTLFGYNSTFVEGWAVYAETEVKPYLPLGSQLISLEHRLWRTCRAWLEPELHTGRLNRHQASHILRHDVVLSPGGARLEIERFTDDPGQAPAYFAGSTRLAELRAETGLLEGEGFDRKIYHDTLLAQGFMPTRFLGQRMRAAFPGAEEMPLAA